MKTLIKYDFKLKIFIIHLNNIRKINNLYHLICLDGKDNKIDTKLDKINLLYLYIKN